MKKHLDLRECVDCYCLAARRKAREITRLYDQYLRAHGLRSTQFSVLVALAQSENVPLGRLAHALGLERTTLTRSTALLERRGWIRSDAATDARVRPLRLTRSGRQKLEAAYKSWKNAQLAAEKKFVMRKI